MTGVLLLLLALVPQDRAAALEAAFERARAAVAEATAGDPAPAIGLAMRAGDETRTWAWGLADVADGRAATVETRFRLASVSKSFTGAVAALLAEEGALDLDAPVQRWLPDFPRHAEGEITPRLLAGHLSGIPHYGADDRFEAGSYHAVRDGLRVFAHRPLAQAPGEKYLYSSYGFNLLGATVEAASGVEFRELLRARLFAPLGMEGVAAEEFGADPGEAASLYRTLLGATVEVPRDDVSYKWPGGGFLARPLDLARYARAYDVDGPALTPRARGLMTTSQRTLAGEETGYSMGLNVGELLGRRSLAHGGSQTGARSFLLIFPDDRVAVAICANHDESRVSESRISLHAAEILLAALAVQSAGGEPDSE